ncbi:MAG: cysteine--tRNA ligase [Minisyncoccia bacterium]
MIKLYNTLTHKKETFKPLHNKKVTLYTCGPTVYSYAHIGNLRTYLFEDILKRVLIINGYKVKHLMNITDVGHLTSDADTGEDKMEKEAKNEKKTAWQIAEFYTQAFFEDIKKLNIIKPNLIKKATDYVSEDIELIKALEKNGFTYKTSDGIYFDSSKLKDYGKLTGMNFTTLNQALQAGARIEISPEKKNITDFSLWKFSPQDVKRQMEWNSPWGIGFPGWHIECATLNLKFLAQAFRGKQLVPEKAQTIDIHCGGIDHIPIHHTNEIAQVEAVTHKPFVKYWLHGEFLKLPKARMGKSEGNAILLNSLIDEGFSPLSYRYLVLNTHYRAPLDFSFEALRASQETLLKIYDFIYDILFKIHYFKTHKIKINQPSSFDLKQYQDKFLQAINNDLNTPQALAILWELINQSQKNINQFSLKDLKNIYQSMLFFDKILGLNFEKIKLIKITNPLRKLIAEREISRQNKDWSQADEIRKQIEQLGYTIKDTSFGPQLKPRTF